MAEFTANSQENEGTKLTPLFIDSGRDPGTTVDLSPPKHGDLDDIQAHTLATCMSEIHEFARAAMIDAQQRYQDQADKQPLSHLSTRRQEHTHPMPLRWHPQ